MAAPTLRLTTKDGNTVEFSGCLGKESHANELTALHKCISKIQKDTNDALTVLVNEENAKCERNGAETSANIDDLDGEDENSDEDEANSESNNEPVKKKPRA
ncbi:hypothetical protein CAPTEDRAFT_213627 [Capitella teleta]|uniref:EKC/KEOPS complex subunit GON7 n=1 Tax=Capitella teleta TaxID=283909 RepID=R7VJ87_CAPTE|nr:hypothetical protein CAPTEDRAFT_213627 [Capitella teleta]|eukprot:ELU16406.1 hypothetical protein CAPTEDRAFT_213627 [Capitella teleta]